MRDRCGKNLSQSYATSESFWHFHIDPGLGLMLWSLGTQYRMDRKPYDSTRDTIMVMRQRQWWCTAWWVFEKSSSRFITHIFIIKRAGHLSKLTHLFHRQLHLIHMIWESRRMILERGKVIQETTTLTWVASWLYQIDVMIFTLCPISFHFD